MATVRLNITIDEDLYVRLKRRLPPKRISAFINEAVRAHLYPDAKSLDEAYKARVARAGEGMWRRCGDRQRLRVGRNEAASSAGRHLLGGVDPTLGSESRKTRPAIVVSNDSCNAYGSRVVVLPVTINVSSLFPGEALVRVEGEPARALGDQLRSIDKRRLRNRIGHLTYVEMRDVDDALRVTLALMPN